MAGARHPGWAVAKEALRSALAAACPGSIVEVGRVRNYGAGLSRAGWAGRVDVHPDPDGRSGTWVALVPSREASEEAGLEARVAREVELLRWLERQALAIRVPRAVDPVGNVLVCGWVGGLPLAELRTDVPGAVRPWEVIAEVARAVHALPRPPFLEGPATRRAHAIAALAPLDALDEPIARDARAWANEHLPPDTPAALLHGDLFGQNVLVHPGEPPGLIDWEQACLGDPAYDLAIAARGFRRPFGGGGGLERLVEAYAAAGGEDLRVEHVRVHALATAAAWVVAERAEPGRDDALRRFRALARRVLG